jgi:ATPase components of various ABC-type transport systems, contain duplicated ATPase
MREVNKMQALVDIEDMVKYFPVKGGVFSKVIDQVHAVDRVSFEIKEGETLGLVGESGCGKTTLGRTVLKLIEQNSGKILFNGVNITEAKGKELRELRKDMQIVFQDPFSSLNPRMTIKE